MQRVNDLNSRSSQDIMVNNRNLHISIIIRRSNDSHNNRDTSQYH